MPCYEVAQAGDVLVLIAGRTGSVPGVHLRRPASASVAAAGPPLPTRVLQAAFLQLPPQPLHAATHSLIVP